MRIQIIHLLVGVCPVFEIVFGTFRPTDDLIKQNFSTSLQWFVILIEVYAYFIYYLVVRLIKIKLIKFMVVMKMMKYLPYSVMRRYNNIRGHKYPG